MNGDEECDLYQTDMERVLSHSILWWQSECRRMELDRNRQIGNREKSINALDKELQDTREQLDEAREDAKRLSFVQVNFGGCLHGEYEGGIWWWIYPHEKKRFRELREIVDYIMSRPNDPIKND